MTSRLDVDAIEHRSFEEDEFQGLDELLDFYLDGNLITTLGNEMRRLTQLQHLSISINRIFTLKPEQIPQTLKFLYFEGNPFKCDCQLLPFLQYLNSSSVGTDGPLCTPSNRTSLLPPAKCPDGCHCFCTQNKDKHFMSVDCSSAGLTELPRLFTTECSSTAKEVSLYIEYRRTEETSSQFRCLNLPSICEILVSIKSVSESLKVLNTPMDKERL
ncbi:hypothetical protein AVEN_57640-1 [Araneus ventricosus]|uniref:Uncharacterized protein n=1 Tax=Araneus ventricosus TaxID=182803 RepID=A0A4Y2QPH4_ARAVE|nr:hypothetical protein AVEN_57640-1 [Araneus ventricosus]